MLTKEQDLLFPLVREPWTWLSFREIKQLAKKTSESYCSTTLKKFVKEEILREKKAGNVTLYALNGDHLKAQTSAGFIAENLAMQNTHIPLKSIYKIIKLMATPFYVLLITGSYAKKTQKPTSDLDMVLLVDDAVDTKHIHAQLRFDCEMDRPEIHLYVFKKAEFREMLLNKEANYGKEIAKKNLIFYGGEVYYQLMNEVISHGFHGSDL